MRRVSYFPFGVLFLSLVLLLSLPERAVQGVRSSTVGFFSYPWRWMHSLRGYLLSAPTLSDRKDSSSQETPDGLSQMALENQKLKSQLESVYEWLLFHERIEGEVERFKILHDKASSQELFWRDFFLRRSEELKKLLEMQVQSLPASVIFREPSSWSSSLWLNVGERDNEALGRQVVAKNSPVLSGKALVGVVEQVEKTKCRVRLITDSGLVPSVRALRGKEQNREILQHLEALQTRLSSREDLFSSEGEKKEASSFFAKIKEKLLSEEDLFLAKGELRGSAEPLWRSAGQTLRGIGFNYDHADREGPARELRSGKIFDKSVQEKKTYEPLLKEGDLLVTTGLDGVFPAGLHVGIVTEILPLEEGSYAYELQAKPCAANMNELSTLFVLPPLDN